jgi:hypothetical protein
MMSKRDEEHMMVPTQPTTHLVMGKADFAFGFFEVELNWPAHTTDLHEITLGRVSRAVAELVFDQAVSSRLRGMISQSSPANLTETITFANQVDAGVVKINEPTRVWSSTLPSADSNNREPITARNRDKTQWIFIPAPR